MHKSGFLSKTDLSLVFTCVNFQVFSEIAGVTESFAAVAALVWSHAHVTHEVHVQFRGCGKRSRAHAAFKLPLAAVSVPVAAGMFVHIRMALPLWRGGGPGALVGHLFLRLRLAVGGVVLGGAMALGVTVQVRLKFRERGTFFTTMANLAFWHSGHT